MINLEDKPDGPPVFVPVALRMNEAIALFNAARSVVEALGLTGQRGVAGELARGMMTLATAIDKTTRSDTDQSDQRCHDCQTIGRNPCNGCPKTIDREESSET